MLLLRNVFLSCIETFSCVFRFSVFSCFVSDIIKTFTPGKCCDLFNYDGNEKMLHQCSLLYSVIT